MTREQIRVGFLAASAVSVCLLVWGVLTASIIGKLESKEPVYCTTEAIVVKKEIRNYGDTFGGYAYDVWLRHDGTVRRRSVPKEVYEATREGMHGLIKHYCHIWNPFTGFENE